MSEREIPLLDSYASDREKAKSEKRTRMVAFVLSLLAHVSGGYEVHRVSEKVSSEHRLYDRETVRDVIFLPATEEELLKHLLAQTGAESVEDIHKNPEKIHAIDLGKYFLQTEFLEGKITAKQAEKAMRVLELKRDVFKKFSEGVSDKRVVVQAILNEIAEPEIFLGKRNVHDPSKDYKRGKSLLSSYLLDGESNCYGATRAFLAMAQNIFPEMPIGLNVFIDHVRPTAVIGDETFIAETGVPLQRFDDAHLDGTVVYPDAGRAFLHELLQFSDEGQLIDRQDTDDNDRHGVSFRLSDIERLGEYENTWKANFRSFLPFFGSLPRRAAAAGEIPVVGDRKKAPLSGDAYDSPENEVQNSAAPSVSRGVSSSQLEARLSAIVQKERFKVDANTGIKKDKKKAVSPQEKPADAAVSPSPAPSFVDYSEHKAGIPMVFEAQWDLQEQILGSLAHPDQSKIFDVRIMHSLAELDKNGLLDELRKRNEKYIADLGSMSALSGGAQNPVVKVEFALADHIRHYKERNGTEQKEFVIEMKKEIVRRLKDEGYLAFYTWIPSDIEEKFPTIIAEDYSVASEELQKFVTDQVIPALQDMESQGKTMKVANIEEVDPVNKHFVFSFLEAHAPQRKLHISGDIQKEILQLSLVMTKNENMSVNWFDPMEGQDVRPLLPFFDQGRILLLDIKDNLFQGLEDSDKLFSIADRKNGKIHQVKSIEERRALGKEFIFEYLVRKAELHPRRVFNMCIDEVRDVDLPPFTSEDMILIGHRLKASHLTFEKGDLLFDNIDSLDWIDAWKAYGIMENPRTVAFSRMHIDFTKLASLASSDTDELVFDNCIIDNWEGAGNKKYKFTATRFAQPMPEEFFERNADRLSVYKISHEQAGPIFSMIKRKGYKNVMISFPMKDDREIDYIFGEVGHTLAISFQKEGHTIDDEIGFMSRMFDEIGVSEMTIFVLDKLIGHDISTLFNSGRRARHLSASAIRINPKTHFVERGRQKNEDLDEDGFIR